MKYLAFLPLILLVGCILSPERKVVTKDYEAPAACAHEDSTTWTDTSEITHMGCIVKP